MLVKDIMTKEVITLAPDDSVTHAAKTLSDNRIGGAPVLDAQGHLIGIVDEHDLVIEDVRLEYPNFIELLNGFFVVGSIKGFEEMMRKAVAAGVRDCMTVEVVTIGPDATIEDAATLMVQRDVSRLPVITGGGHVVGMITEGDIVRSLARP